jgi:hypothetical protein
VFDSDPYLLLTFRSFTGIAKRLDAASLILFLHLGTNTTRLSQWYVQADFHVSVQQDFSHVLLP